MLQLALEEFGNELSEVVLMHVVVLTVSQLTFAENYEHLVSKHPLAFATVVAVNSARYCCVQEQ